MCEGAVTGKRSCCDYIYIQRLWLLEQTKPGANSNILLPKINKAVLVMEKQCEQSV